MQGDSKGNIWIAAFDGVFRYDGKSFTNITSKVTSARFFSVLEDRKGNFWFGGKDRLWRYDGSVFTNFTQQFVGYVIEDKKGNIWTSAESDNGENRFQTSLKQCRFFPILMTSPPLVLSP